MSKDYFKITRYKSAREINWLKSIHVALVDKYFVDITNDDFNYVVGHEVLNSVGETIGEIIDLFDSNDKTWVKVQLSQRVNFDTLIQLGIPIEQIVFDCHHWDYDKGYNIDGSNVIIG